MSRPTTASSTTTTTTELAAGMKKPIQRSQGHGLKEKVIFTGPDGLRPGKRRNLLTEFNYVAECEMSTPERTTAISYLTSQPKGIPFPLAKNGRPGEIGWEAEHFPLGPGATRR